MSALSHPPSPQFDTSQFFWQQFHNSLCRHCPLSLSLCLPRELAAADKAWLKSDAVAVIILSNWQRIYPQKEEEEEEEVSVSLLLPSSFSPCLPSFTLPKPTAAELTADPLQQASRASMRQSLSLCSFPQKHRGKKEGRKEGYTV